MQDVLSQAEMIYEDGTDRPSKIIGPPRESPFGLDTWLKHYSRRGPGIVTATVLFRPVHEPLPGWYRELQSGGDIALYLWLLTHGGNMGPISTTGPMTVYRKHLGGVTQRIVSQNTTEQIAAYENLIADAARFSTILTSQQRNFLRPHLYRYNLMLTQDYLQLGNRKQARSKLHHAVFYSHLIVFCDT